MTPRTFRMLHRRLKTDNGNPWSQARLADALGVSRITINRWERGRQPIPETAALLLKRIVNDWDKSPQEPTL